MSQQILVNTSPYETRVALLENGEIRQLHIEREEDRNVVGNVYLGVVKRVLPGMQAAFLELGLERTAFLYVDDIIQEPLGDVEIISPDDESGGEGSSDTEEDWGDDDDADDGWDEETPDEAPAEEEDEEIPGGTAPEGAAPAEAEEEGPEENEKWTEGDPDKPVREARGPREPDDRSGRGPRREDEYDDRSDRPAPGNERERYDSRGDYRGESPARDDRPRRGGAPVAGPDRSAGGGGRGGRGGSGGGGEPRGRDDGRRNESRDRQDRGPRPEREGGRENAPREGARDSAPREGGRDAGRGGRDRDAERGGDRGGRGRDEGRGRGPSEADDAIYTEARQVERSRERAREYVDDSERSPDRDRDRERLEPRSPERGDRNGERGGGGRGRRDEGRGSEAKERAPEGRPEGRPESRSDRNDEPRRASGGGGGGGGRDRERGGRGGRGRRGGGGSSGGGGGSSSRDHRGGGGNRGRRRHMPRKPRVTANIQDLLKEGQEILVQVAKAPIGTKGARLTTHISLPGRNLVLMPTVKHIGISRRIESDRERRRLRDIFTKRIQAPGVGFIVRTVAEGKSYRELRADADYLIKMWAKIQKESKRKRAPSLIHEDLSLGMRAVRDLFTDDVDQFIIDNEEEFHLVSSFIGQFMPRLKARVKLYKGPQQLFEHYGIEAEISRALGKKVWLKSGGYLLVDQSEALTAIDVNTGRYVGSKSLEETILKTNLEAVKEIAYQLRIRNVGGIIIIDLIDMESMENREKVFHALQEALGEDRARTNILKISDLGLVEMTRKRTHEDLVRYLTEVCAYCEGRGYHKSQRTVCFEIFREVEKESSQPGKQIVVFANPQVAGRLLHEEKKNVEQLEKKIDRMISVRPDPEFHIEQYEVFAKQ